jgi:hypothetical protein
MCNIQRGFVTRQLASGGCQDLFRSFNVRSPCQAELKKVIGSTFESDTQCDLEVEFERLGGTSTG